MAKGHKTLQKKSTSSASQVAASEGQILIPLASQQRVLDVFRDACSTKVDDLQATTQVVKQHLFNRDFFAAFSKEEYLWAYATRWSPSRALAYQTILQDIMLHLLPRNVPHQRSSECHALPRVTSKSSPARSDHSQSANCELDGDSAAPPSYDQEQQVPPYEHPPAYPASFTRPDADEAVLQFTCIGGGAGAEVVAIAAWTGLHSQRVRDGQINEGATAAPSALRAKSVKVNSIDIADWSAVVTSLCTASTTSRTLSKYASADAIVANSALLAPDEFAVDFEKHDVLNADLDKLRVVFQNTDVITIMFTLNELYSTSVSKTQRLLFELTVSSRPGTLLLVVDSPGSYSTVTINGSEKKYPMQWLLDHTLLTACANTRILPRGTHWEKVISDDSRWFRMPQGLKYAVDLENMRYQIHLYRRCEVKAELEQ